MPKRAAPSGTPSTSTDSAGKGRSRSRTPASPAGATRTTGGDQNAPSVPPAAATRVRETQRKRCSSKAANEQEIRDAHVEGKLQDKLAQRIARARQLEKDGAAIRAVIAAAALQCIEVRAQYQSRTAAKRQTQRVQEDAAQVESAMEHWPPSDLAETATTERFWLIVRNAVAAATRERPASAAALAPLIVRSERGLEGALRELLECWRSRLSAAWAAAHAESGAEARNQHFQAPLGKLSIELYDRLATLHQPRLDGRSLDVAWGAVWLHVLRLYRQRNRPAPPALELQPRKELSLVERGVADYVAGFIVRRQLRQAKREKNRRDDQPLLELMLDRDGTRHKAALPAAVVAMRERWGGLLRVTQACSDFFVRVESELARYMRADLFVRVRGPLVAQADMALRGDLEIASMWRAMLTPASVLDALSNRPEAERREYARRVECLRKMVRARPLHARLLAAVRIPCCASSSSQVLRRYLNTRSKVLTKKMQLLVHNKGQGQAIRTKLKAAEQLKKSSKKEKEVVTIPLNTAALVNLSAANAHSLLVLVAAQNPGELLRKLDKAQLRALLAAYDCPPPRGSSAKPDLHELLVAAIQAKAAFEQELSREAFK